MAKIRPSGGYRDLRSFQIATIIYDATYWFCERFLDRVRERATRWCRLRAVAGRILPKAAAHPPPPPRPNSGWSTSRAPAWRNSCSTTKIFCGTATCENGRRMIPKRWRFGGSGKYRTDPVGLNGSVR